MMPDTCSQSAKTFGTQGLEQTKDAMQLCQHFATRSADEELLPCGKHGPYGPAAQRGQATGMTLGGIPHMELLSSATTATFRRAPLDVETSSGEAK
jgi:hypothetical protein